MADYNECKLAFFQLNGATSPDLQDAEREYLIGAGMTPASNQDMWHEMLGPGHLNDLLYEFWVTNGCGGPVTGGAFDMDNDGLPDSVISGNPGDGNPSVTEDADSINFDADGDGVADVVVPK